jgi:hypothetical protein
MDDFETKLKCAETILQELAHIRQRVLGAGRRNDVVTKEK